MSDIFSREQERVKKKCIVFIYLYNFTMVNNN